MMIELVIHTDTMPNPNAEYGLCEARGRSLVRALKSWGIPESSIRILPKGSSQPLPDDYRQAMGFANERVEYRLVEMEK